LFNNWSFEQLPLKNAACMRIKTSGLLSILPLPQVKGDNITIYGILFQKNRDSLFGRPVMVQIIRKPPGRFFRGPAGHGP
jgi:hypothetical protein